MKTYGEIELRNSNWFGLKPILRWLLLIAPINAVIVALCKPVSLRFPSLRRLPVRKNYVEFMLQSGQKIQLLDPMVCDVARDVFWGGGQRVDQADCHVMKFFEVIVADADIFIDVGSYSGLFTLVAAETSKKIHCFAYEILPDAFLMLIRNIVQNDVVDRCEMRLRGLGNAPSIVTMPKAVSNAILPSSLSLGSVFPEGTRIPVSTIDDDFFGVKGSSVTVKIDVEGFESAVIEGAAHFIENNSVEFVCEILPNADDGEKITSFLVKMDYQFFQFTSRGLIQHAAITPSKEGKDWLFTKRQPQELKRIAEKYQ
jgi:FkbM family methyltransferase